MPFAVLYATERTSLSANKPTATEIETAFRLALYPVAGRARWVGPMPRITRYADLGMVITHAAWLLEAESDDAIATVLPELNRSLREHGGPSGSADWSLPTAQPYAPDFHGSLEWWSSGQAASTRTREVPDNIIARYTLAEHENPVGPNVDPLQRRVGSIVGGVILAGLVGGAIYVAAKFAGRPAALPAPKVRRPRRAPASRQLPAKASAAA